MMSAQRICQVCGVKTKQFADENSYNGQPVWRCDNCNTETNRIVRVSKRSRAVDALFNELAGD